MLVLSRLAWTPFGILLWFGLFLQSVNASPHKKLLVLGIDGCRPDALLRCRAPNLRALAENGIYTWYALSRPPTKSGPCYSSIFTGVWNDKHGVTDNTFTNQRFDRYPMLFRRLKDADPAFYSGWFVYWPNLDTDMPHGADVSSGGWSDTEVQDWAVDLLKNGNPDALFVQFGAIDAAGHLSGFDPDKSEYLDAIEEVDGRVGTVMSALKARAGFANEGWMIVALSDHGGLSTHHGGSTIEEMRTFFIVSGDNVPHREIGHDWVQKTCVVPPYGIRLDGKDDCIRIPDASQYHFGSGQDFTVEFLMRTSEGSGRFVIFGNKDMSFGKNPGFALVRTSEGNWMLNVADGTNEEDISGPYVADDRWHHIAVVFKRQGTLSLFQDGIRTGALDISDIGNIDTPYGITVGQDGPKEYPYFASQSVSELRVWRTALADSVIWAWLFTPVTDSHPNYADLAGYWKMNDGSGAILSDYSAYANHGILAGGDPVWVAPDERVETLRFDSCRTAKTVDLAVTALAHFGLENEPNWDLDGKNLVSGQNPAAVHYSRLSSDPSLSLKNFPNPFNGQTLICFSMPAQGRATMEIFDVLGRRIACLLDQLLPAGDHQLVFSGEGLSSGVYILNLSTPTARLSTKILLMK
jgi:hypothetical protein